MKIHEKYGWLSASADGVMKCTCHGIGVIEIKCPYTLQNSSLDEVLLDKKSYIFNYCLSKNHKYYTQVQIEMEVYDAEYCKFLVLEGIEIAVIDIQRDR